MLIYNFGTQLLIQAARLINGLLLVKAEEFTRIPKDPVKPASEKDLAGIDKVVVAQVSSSWARFMDALEIGLLAVRGVGWNYQAKKIPGGKPADYPRFRFVVENLCGAIWRTIAIDLTMSYIRTTPMSDPSPIGRLGITAAPVHLRLFRGVLIFYGSRLAMDLIYSIAASVFVGIGLYNPSDYPPLMGKKRDAYTVRRFWSHTWHQMLRPIAEPPTNYIVHNILHIKKGSYISNYSKVFSAFFVAYVVHAYATHMAGGDQLADWNFFMSQAVAIWVEETIVKIVKGATGFGATKQQQQVGYWIGYLWTIAFVSVSGTFWFEGYANSGAYMLPPFFGVSLVETALAKLGI
ncbi:hypothetical protein AAFC00_007319 [Neodothiora populina]